MIMEMKTVAKGNLPPPVWGDFCDLMILAHHTDTETADTMSEEDYDEGAGNVVTDALAQEFSEFLS